MARIARIAGLPGGPLPVGTGWDDFLPAAGARGRRPAVVWAAVPLLPAVTATVAAAAIVAFLLGGVTGHAGDVTGPAPSRVPEVTVTTDLPPPRGPEPPALPAPSPTTRPPVTTTAPATTPAPVTGSIVTGPVVTGPVVAGPVVAGPDSIGPDLMERL